MPKESPAEYPGRDGSSPGKPYSVPASIAWCMFWSSLAISIPSAAVGVFATHAGPQRLADVMYGVAGGASAVGAGAIFIGIVVLFMRDARHG